MELPKVTIGGEDIVLPAIMRFAELKRVWPAIRAFDEAEDEIARVSAALAFIAQALLPTRPELTLVELEKRLLIQRFDPDRAYWQEARSEGGRVVSRLFDQETNEDVTFGDPKRGRDERPGLLAAVNALLRASGLVARGEARPAPATEAPAPGPDGTETSTTSSLSSPPPG